MDQPHQISEFKLGDQMMINENNSPDSDIKIKVYLKNLLIKGDKWIIIRKLGIRVYVFKRAYK